MKSAIFLPIPMITIELCHLIESRKFSLNSPSHPHQPIQGTPPAAGYAPRSPPDIRSGLCAGPKQWCPPAPRCRLWDGRRLGVNSGAMKKRWENPWKKMKHVGKRWRCWRFRCLKNCQHRKIYVSHRVSLFWCPSYAFVPLICLSMSDLGAELKKWGSV